MPPYPDFGTGSVSHGSIVAVKSFVELPEKSSCSDGGAPCCGIHGELLEVLQVDDNRAVDPSEP
jgi:hypothetical protein